ncbi:MAG: metal-dependent hydrolase, partial [Candidatus Lokiarchaeota archaeon]
MFLVFYAIFMGALPDLDVFLNPLNKIYKSEAFSHKGGSHSFTAALLVSFLFGFSISIIFKLSLILYWIIGLLFYSLHIILDTLASSRVPIFYPF